jgi:hypothetical protein
MGSNSGVQWDSRLLLWQREEWIRFNYSNEDTKDEEKKELGRRGMTKCPRAVPKQPP